MHLGVFKTTFKKDILIRNISYKILSVLIFTIFVEQIAFSQDKDHEKQKAEIIWELPKYLKWSSGNGDVEVGILGGSKLLMKELKRLEKKHYPHGKSFKIVYILNPDIVAEFNVQILYVSKEYAANYEEISKKIRPNHTILITEAWGVKKSVMVNFVENEDEFIEQINARNIAETGAQILSNIKKENVEIIDDRYLLNESEENLRKERQKVKEQQDKLDLIEKDLEYKQKKLDRQKAEIDASERKIGDQKKLMSTLIEQANTQRKELNAKNTVLLLKEKDIEIQNQKLTKQQLQVKEQTLKLGNLNKAVKENQARINEQGFTLLKQSATIKFQKNALTIFIGFFVIIGILVFFILRGYRITRRQNKQLGLQKQEIQQQAGQLEIINKELEKLSIVASETSSAVAILDIDGNFEWVNAGFTRMYGYTLQLLRNEVSEHIVGASNHPQIQEFIRTCIDKKTPVIYETYVTARSGEKKWSQTTLSPTINALGEVNQLVLIDSDITKIKEAENEILKQNEMILAQAHELELNNFELEKLSIVASKTENSVVIAQPDGEIEWVNDGFTRLLGLTFDEFKKKYSSNMFKSSLIDDLKERVEQAVTEKKSIIYSAKTKTSENRIIWIQTTLTPILTTEGNLRKIIAIDADVTQIKLAEEQIALQNKKITDSILYAQRIQSAILPPQEIISDYLPENFILFRPRDIVSGDFYWAAQKGNRLIVTAADCTGHGVPGAFMSMLGISYLNEIMANFSDEEITSDLILNELRNKVKISLRQTGKEGEAKDGMDMALCIIDKTKGIVEFSGAENPLVIVRNNQIIDIKPDFMPIGISYEEKPFRKEIIPIQKGDWLYMFSDGYADQFSQADRKKFFSKRLKDFLKNNSKESASKQAELLNNNFDAWRGSLKQMDDVLIIGMKIS